MNNRLKSLLIVLVIGLALFYNFSRSMVDRRIVCESPLVDVALRQIFETSKSSHWKNQISISPTSFVWTNPTNRPFSNSETIYKPFVEYGLAGFILPKSADRYFQPIEPDSNAEVTGVAYSLRRDLFMSFFVSKRTSHFIEISIDDTLYLVRQDDFTSSSSNKCFSKLKGDEFNDIQ